ncbi:MAG: hypothetical protein JWM68_5431 [Verrucomicrobiales bacterium]|nr:hypothetical protein [Verrucomicrobiales bacterium]
MNDAKQSGSSEGKNSTVQEQLDVLKKMLMTTLVVVIVFSGAVNLYLLAQVRTVNKELTREQLILDQYNQNELPNISAFLSNLKEYAKTHPDINPILAKYHLTSTTGSVSPPSK